MREKEDAEGKGEAATFVLSLRPTTSPLGHAEAALLGKYARCQDQMRDREAAAGKGDAVPY